MSLERRKFVKKSVLGVMSLSLLPASISLLDQEGYFFTVDGLFSGLSFKRRFFSDNYLTKNFGIPEMDSGIKRTGKVFVSDKTFCVHEQHHYCSDFKSDLVSVYEKRWNGFEKVISLQEVELKAMNYVIGHLKNETTTSDINELRKRMIPTFKTKRHATSNRMIDGPASSSRGFYTAHGYCSLQIKAKGNRYRIDASLLSTDKLKTFHKKFNLRSLS